MIVTVTAPKKGLGQTITAINLAASCRNAVDDRVLLVDINKYCRDVEYFLSDTEITKGLDEFIGLHTAGMLNEDSFGTCVKNAGHGIDIMAPNNCLEIDSRIVENLIKYSSKAYGTTVIDSIGGNNSNTNLLFRHSDAIIVVLNQSKNVVEMAVRSKAYREFEKKVIFILNKHISAFENKKIQYTLHDIKDDLQKAGFSCPIFPLEYDADILNECNDHSILNLILNSRNGSSLYIKQLEKLMLYIHGERQSKNKKSTGKNENGLRDRLVGLILGG